MGELEFLNITKEKLGSYQNGSVNKEKQESFQGAVIPSIQRQQYTKLSPCDEDNENPHYSTYDHNMVDKPRFKLGSVLFHMLTCTLLISYLFFNTYYLAFKFQLYYHHFFKVLASPWLFLILICECLYLVSSIISSIDFFVPPPVWTPASLSLQRLLSHQSCDSKHYIDVEKSDSTNPASICSSLYPTVDVFIPCCKEPTDVPIDTIRSALALHYPKDRFNVMVLDDGADDELRKFCESLESRGQLMYLRRKKVPGVPHHFKCGNMNFGLKHSTAEYVVMMDADMILHPAFLDKLLPHIINSPNIAFVQTPQSYYNLPKGDPLNDSCDFGYDRVMPHRNTMGCASCVGTGVVLRRKHLDSIGGFQPQSITEDTMTAYVLFNRGYRSVYVNEKLQAGLVPWTFEGFVKQRQRWGQGALQQFAATWRVIIGPGNKLNWVQRACYFWHTGYYYMSVLNVVLVFTLWAALAFELNLTVGTEEENRELYSLLSLYLISWNVFWIVMWLEVPQSIQSRNRDASQFWWMTPFFFQMVVDAAFDFQKTFKFVPTSSIDQQAQARVSDSACSVSGYGGASCVSGFWKRFGCSKKIRDLKHLRVHIVFIVVILCTVAFRGYTAATRNDDNKRPCEETLLVCGLSIFLLMIVAHMLVPMLYIIFPTGYSPSERKSLLKYNAQGIPSFDPKQCAPKWHFSSAFYEFITYFIITFWIGAFWFVKTNSYHHWCENRSL